MDTHQAILSSANAFRHSCLHGRWSDAREAAVSLALTAASAAEATDSCSEVEEMEGFTDTRKTDALWVAASSARAGLLKMLAAFSARAARGPSRDLALATAAACTAMLPEVWPSGSADDLLSMSGVPGLLLRAVALVSRATPGLGGFATLRACRAAAELFAALLEASMPELRQACEAALFRDSSLSSPMHSIAEALLGSNPDPRLNEAILEILWRGLRRVPFGAALAALSSAHPALVCLEDRQVGLCSNLQKLSADQLLADCRGLALELAAVAPNAMAYECCADNEIGTAIFSSHCLALHQEGEMEPKLELPWELLRLQDLAGEGLEVRVALSLDLEELQELGCVSEEALLSSTLELMLEGSPEDVRETFEHYMSECGRAGLKANGKEPPALVWNLDPIVVQDSPQPRLQQRLQQKEQERQEKLQREKQRQRKELRKEQQRRQQEQDEFERWEQWERLEQRQKEQRGPRKQKQQEQKVLPKREAQQKLVRPKQVVKEEVLSQSEERPPRRAKPAVPIQSKQGVARTVDVKAVPRPPQDAVQRVLEEASRLAREVAEVQKQFQQSKVAVENRGNEATAFLDDIEKAGSKRCRAA
ncbi:unnamed protein product [Effrenium voratum]|uniref:Uncharacterized protein n=1 Tax=Effrenium voratum TaxID=2562239 RepID=A0AA36MNR1_9DINO|nr:unnamed protein product [Effrenium voratum]